MKSRRISLRIAVAILVVTVRPDAAPAAGDALMPGSVLTNEQVEGFARLAIEGIPREYPNKPSNVMQGPESVLSPREMHPVFYGCFDWHSSVHGHWMLARLARLYPDAPIAAEIRQLLDRQLTRDGLAAEAAYFEAPENRSFERTYGWAWTLRLAQELRTWDDPDATRWAANLGPLERIIVRRTREYLPRLTYPIRTGVHPDTAFALGMAIDYARAIADAEFEAELLAYCHEKYLADRDYSARFEPSGEDFFSPSLNEADLMRRVIAPGDYAAWLEAFLPGIGRADSANGALLKPAVVSDPSDPKIVHLAGLNLSRAWTQDGVRRSLPEGDPRRAALDASVAAHTRAGLDYVVSGHYEGEHWLATFAVYLLTEAGVGR